MAENVFERLTEMLHDALYAAWDLTDAPTRDEASELAQDVINFAARVLAEEQA